VDSQTIIALGGLLTAAVTGFGGTYLGSRLSRQTARDIASDQREWDESQAVRMRRDDAAAELDAALDAAFAGTAFRKVPPSQATEQLGQARQAMTRAWVRTGLLIGDVEIDGRIRTLNAAAFVGEMSENVRTELVRTGRTAPNTVNTWPVAVALQDVRRALAAFQAHEDPPDADCPPADKVVELAYPSGGGEEGLDGLKQYLADHGV
jgi:hypothetical protein